MHFLRPFDPWRSDNCTCRGKYSLSPYTGCSHGCLYCYASSYIKDFAFPRPKKEFIKKLSNDLKNADSTLAIALSNSSDCYQPLEKELNLTRRTLELLIKYQNPVAITTKSPLITRDTGILKMLKRCTIAITITTLNDALSKKLEPYAPSPALRLDAIKKLSGTFYTICRLDPIIYSLTDNNLRKTVKKLKEHGVSQIITSTYKTKPDNKVRMFQQFPEYAEKWSKLYDKNGYLPYTLRKNIIRKIASECEKEKIHFSSCREDFKEFNTTECDGNVF